MENYLANMEKKIKLIWDFFGEDALKIAEHHAIHLKEFTKREKIEQFGCGTHQQGEQAMAYLIVGEENMIPVRDALRPKRGEWVEV